LPNPDLEKAELTPVKLDVRDKKRIFAWEDKQEGRKRISRKGGKIYCMFVYLSGWYSRMSAH